MVIHELSRDECLGLLANARVGRLGCARDNQPYVVPIYFAYDRSLEGESYLYGFTTVGRKVEWMRANPRVCVEWDDVTRHDEWVSVIVFGRYEELADAEGDPAPAGRAPARSTEPPTEDWGPARDRRRAHEILQQYSTWWQPGAAAHAARAHRDPAEPFKPVYYRVRIEQVTGHRATPDAGSVSPAPEPARRGWLARALRGLTGR